MNSMFAVVALFAVLATAQAGVIVAPSAHVNQGPSSRSTVVGPDGSSISAVAQGAQIVSDEISGVVASTGPVAHTSIAAAPVVAYSAPIVAHAAPVAYAAPVVAHHGLVAHGAESTVVSGPSGVITRNTYGHPTVVAHGLHGLVY